MIQKNDKRRYPRIQVPSEAPEVLIYLVSDSGSVEPRRVRAFDLGRMGMSFHDKSAVRVGTRCTVLINHRRQAIRIVGRTTNAHPGPNGGHIIGVMFLAITPIASEDLLVPLCDDATIDALLVDPSAS